MTEPLARFPLIIELPILWGDQDAFGHVNNTVMIRWFESARVAYLADVGIEEMMERDRVGPILAAVQCNYRRQLKYPDNVRIGAAVTRLGNSSMTMEHAIVAAKDGHIAAEGTSTVVLFDYQNQRSHRIPDDIRERIDAFEKR